MNSKYIPYDKYIKDKTDLYDIDLTDTDLRYEDIIVDDDIMLDLKCDYPQIMNNNSYELFVSYNHEDLIKAAGYSRNPLVLIKLINILNYHPTENYLDSVLYHFNKYYPNSQAAIVLYSYSSVMQTVELERGNIVLLQRMIDKGDYNYNVGSCKLVIKMDNINKNLLENIIIETLTKNQFYDEDTEFLCKCISLNIPSIIELIPNMTCLFNVYNTNIISKLLLMYNGEISTLELENEHLLLKYAPYELLINSNVPDKYLDRAYKDYLVDHGTIPNKLIHYPQTLSYALANDIDIAPCIVTAEDVFEYPNLISIYHIQRSKLLYEQIISNKSLVFDKYIDLIIHASIEELEGFIEITFIIPNITHIVSYRWLAALCNKCGAYDMSQWLLTYKNVPLIMRRFHEEVNDSDDEE